MKRATLGTLILSFLAAGAVFGLRGANPQSNGAPEAFVGRIRGLLQRGDFPAYLEAFTPELRAVEQDRLKKFFGDLEMNEIGRAHV